MTRNEKIENLREKLYEKIEKFGVNSEEAMKISVKIDKLINEQYENEKQYPECNNIKETYYKCIEILKETLKETGSFPTVKSWDKYAFNNNLLSHISIEHICNMNWSKLEKYIQLQIK